MKATGKQRHLVIPKTGFYANTGRLLLAYYESKNHRSFNIKWLPGSHHLP